MSAPVRVVGFASSADYRLIVTGLRESDQHDYDVVLCDSYPDLLARAAAGDCGLVLLDFDDLPRGEEDLVELRRRTEAPIMAFVGDPEQTKSALRSGADYDLPKPFDPAVFVVAVEAVLRRAAAPPVATILPVQPPFAATSRSIPTGAPWSARAGARA